MCSFLLGCPAGFVIDSQSFSQPLVYESPHLRDEINLLMVNIIHLHPVSAGHPGRYGNFRKLAIRCFVCNGSTGFFSGSRNSVAHTRFFPFEANLTQDDEFDATSSEKQT